MAALQATGLAQGWPGHGRDPQHSNIGAGPAQAPGRIRWQVPVDLNPQFSGEDLLIHYGSPVITRVNTILAPVKTGATDHFRVEALRPSDGSIIWSYDSDYTQPAHNWTLPFGIALAPKDRVIAFPGAGGTMLTRTFPDVAGQAVTRLAFYGMANYNANPAAFNAAIQINTPVSIDKLGNYFFGYVSTGAALPGYPNGIPSGLARIPASGVGGAFVSAASIAGDQNISKVVHNCAPGFSNDGASVYVAVNGNGGYLARLNSTTLVRQNSVFLLDPSQGSAARVADDGSGTPTIGPDGDVYYGVLETNFGTNHARGWLLHFNSDLTSTKLPSAFGWDDTASIVPASIVPSYAGTSSYLLLTKYNNYASVGGDGVNKLALVDPNVSMTDPVTGVTVMNAFMTVAGVTPDSEFIANHPNAVREWCINSAAIDPATKSAVVNSEDGHVYRWDFVSNTLRFDVPLEPPTGEAYTPTLIGPDGAVYAINNATLHSVVAAQ